MRIAFLLTQSLESPSGLGRYWPLAKELARLGHLVTILALHPDYQMLRCKEYYQDGVQVHYVGQMHVIKRGNTKSYFGSVRLMQVTLLATWQLLKHALLIPADIYHVGKPHPMNGLAGLFASRLKRKPMYLDCDDYEAGSNRFSANWQRRVVAGFEDRLPAAAAGITVNTHFTQQRLEHLGVPAERIVYVPNGVDRERFDDIPRAAAVNLRRELRLGTQKVVLYVGSLSLTSHPVDLLLEAFSIVHQNDSDTVLVLVGGGEDLQQLRNQAQMLGIEEDVRFVGRVHPARVPPYFHLANVSVDPVHNDPVALARFPLKLVESLSAGTPVITGNVGDRADLLANGGGLLVQPGSKTALADAILQVLQNSSPFR